MLAEAIRRIFYILIIGICVVSSRVIHCVDAFCSSTILKIENERRQILQAVYTRQTNGLVMYKTDPQKSRRNHQSKLMIIDHETSLSFMHCINWVTVDEKWKCTCSSNAHALVKLDELKKEHLKLKKELALWTINKNRTYDNDFLHHDDIVYICLCSVTLLTHCSWWCYLIAHSIKGEKKLKLQLT